MPRAPGTRNKDSKRVLHDLEERGFDLVEEILEIYGYNKKIMMRFFRRIEKLYKMYEDKGADIPPIEVLLTEEDMELFKQVRNDNLNILSKLFGFCFPKLKAFTVSQNLQEQIVFNINLSGNDAPKLAGSSTAFPVGYRAQGAIDVSPKKLPIPVIRKEGQAEQV